MATRSAISFYFVLLILVLVANVANLIIIGIEGNPLAALNCGVAALLLVHPRLITFTRKERGALLFFALTMCASGAISYNLWYGYALTPLGIPFALIMLSGYIIARYLLQVGLAYAYALAGFLLMLMPSLYWMATSGASTLDAVIVHGSENFVTTWLIITSLAMVAAKLIEGQKPPLWPMVVTFAISVSQYTRASIVVSLLALAATIYFRLGIKWALAFALMSLVASLPFGNLIYSEIINAIQGTKFGQQGIETPRWEMWASYWEALTPESILFGTDTDLVPVIDDFSGNPHNSFIRFHAYFGIVPFVAGIWALGKIGFGSRRYLFVPMGLILLRAVSDVALVGTALDNFFMIGLGAAFLSAHVFAPAKRQAGRRRPAVA